MHEKSAGCNRTGEYKQCCTFAPKQDRKQIPDPLRSPRLSDRTNESSTQPSTGAVIFEPGEVEPSIQNLLQGRPFLMGGYRDPVGPKTAASFSLSATAVFTTQSSARSMSLEASLATSHLVEGALTNGLPASKKRSSRPTSRVMPMRTVVLTCAVSRAAVPSQSGPLAHRSTPSSCSSICNAAASRPGPLAKSLSLSVLRSRFMRLIPSRGSMARNSTPAPTPGSSAVTLSMYDIP